MAGTRLRTTLHLPSLPPRMMPKDTKRPRKIRTATEEESDIQLALEWHNSDPKKNTLRQAAKKFDVGRKKLMNRRDGIPPPHQAHSKEQVLYPAEEEVIAAWALGLADRGFPITIRALREHANKILEHRVGPDFRPIGANWTSRFLARFPEVDRKWRRSLDHIRAGAADPEVMSHYYSLLQEAVMRIPPERRYNMDEKSIMLGRLDMAKVLIRRGSKPTQLQDGNRETVTIIECICGDGTTIAPTVIFPGKNLYEHWVNNNPLNMNTTASERGWTHNGFGVKWIEVFDQTTADKCPNGEPRLLILDGHSSHVSYEFIQYARDHNIEVLCLPPHSTAFLQPLDVAVFSPLGHYWSKVVLKQTGLSRAIQKQDFCRLYAMARVQAFTPTLIRKAFEAMGIEPYDPNRINLTKEAPAKIAEQGTLPVGPSDAVLVGAGSDEVPETTTVLDEAAEALEMVPQTEGEVKMQGVIGKLQDELVASSAREVLTHERATVLEEATQLRRDGKRRKIGHAQWLTGDEKWEALEQSKREQEEAARAKEAKAKAGEQKKVKAAAEKAEKQKMKEKRQQERKTKKEEKEREKEIKRFEREMVREAKKMEEKSRKAERAKEREQKKQTSEEAKGQRRHRKSNKENLQGSTSAGQKRKRVEGDNLAKSSAKRSRTVVPAPTRITRSGRQTRVPCRDLNAI